MGILPQCHNVAGEQDTKKEKKKFFYDAESFQQVQCPFAPTAIN